MPDPNRSSRAETEADTASLDAAPEDASFAAAVADFAEHATPRLSDTLATRPDAAAHADVVWTTHDSAVGPLLFAFRDHALIRVAFASEGFDAVIDTLAERMGRRMIRSSHPAEGLRREMDEYLAGRRRAFTVPFSLTLSTAPFRREVQQSLSTIGYGRTASYAQIADAAGRPRAVRAVGTACATNPVPLVLPCHRVLRSDGGIGNYLGGTDLKRQLLAMEAAHASEAI